MAPPSPGADRPDQTTGARRRVTVPTTGMRAVSADAPPVSREMRGDCAFCAEELYAETRVVDDDLRRVAVDFHHAERRGSFVEP